jgi:hypothetical protein
LKIFSHQNLSPEFTISAANANAAAHKAATQRFLQNITSITDHIAVNQNDNQPPNATTRTNKVESTTLSVAANWRLQFFSPLRFVFFIAKMLTALLRCFLSVVVCTFFEGFKARFLSSCPIPPFYPFFLHGF